MAYENTVNQAADSNAEVDDVTKDKDRYRVWMNQITDAQKREKMYRKVALKCVELYEAKNPSLNPFAILYSNTETLVPALYNARPIPIVKRRFNDEDPVGKLAAEVATRVNKYLIEVESADYDSFDENMQAEVLETAVTNRGNVRYRYEAKTDDEKVEAECVYGEVIKYDKFFHGYARTWKKVPWIGFEWDMSKEEIKENFGEEMAAKFRYTDADAGGDADARSGESREELTGVMNTKIYEIWDKVRRKVMFISPSYPEGIIKEVEDPLELQDFYPIPKPMNFMRKISTLVPTPLYVQYEEQAKELNELTRRLKMVIKSVKVRGFYNKTIEGIEKVLKAEDNDLIPVENISSMPDSQQGADKLLWLMPLTDLVNTAQTLQQQREQCKMVIYEITGISDILRGASVASETATAQQIKNQWGSLRLKKMQKEVQRYCRDSLVIMLEIAVTKFSIETIEAMTGLKYPRAAQKQQAQQQVQMIQQQAAMQAQQAEMQAQFTGQPAQSLQPPEIPPQLQQILDTPSWEEILAVLKSDTQRNYRVDIETNSTIDAEAAQDKQDIAELMNAMSQWLNGIAPLVEKGTLPADVAKNMLLVISRRYNFGSQLEESLNQLTQPPPKEPDPAETAKLQAVEAKAKADMAKSQADMQKTQLEMQRDAAKNQQETELMQLEMQLKKEELLIKQQELEMQRQALGMKTEAMMMQHQVKVAGIRAKSEADEAAAKQKEATSAAV